MNNNQAVGGDER